MQGRGASLAYTNSTAGDYYKCTEGMQSANGRDKYIRGCLLGSG